MLSFRVDESDAGAVTRWAEQLGVDRSELLREALHAHLARLANERDAEVWQRQPLTEDERALDAVEHWLPAEDWSDWAPAAGAASSVDEAEPR